MNNELKIKIAENCGMVFDGMMKDDDGNEYPQFIGTDKQWQAYTEELERQENIGESDLQEARRLNVI